MGVFHCWKIEQNWMGAGVFIEKLLDEDNYAIRTTLLALFLWICLHCDSHVFVPNREKKGLYQLI